tara:strand:+ start:1155 stop:2213 length:1059 start_codon:yes stop_codon:yes gene_type:complete
MKSKNYSKKILEVFKKRRFVFSEPEVLLDSNYIIQRSGENFKKLMLTFEDDSGKNMCLRPDLTVASCVKYLEENSKGTSKIYYSGQAYRRSNDNKDSIINDQLGIEIIGSKKKSLDDKEVINTILKSINKIKIKKVTVNIGDVSLFRQLIESLKIPERWKLRLIRHFWRPDYFEDLLNRLETNSDIDPIAVNFDKKRFSEMKKLDPNAEIAGRKISEILSRFDKKIRDPRSFAEGKKTAKIIRNFLKISCPIEQMDRYLKNFFEKNNIKKDAIKNTLPVKSLPKNGYKIIFSTNFGRNIEYYTGMVFEISALKKEIARGGRYDDLLKSLGSKKNVSAVGAAINLNNLSRVVQ